MKNIDVEAKKYQDLSEVKKELRNVQSKKTRLKKQKARQDYNKRMQDLLEQEQVLKEVRSYFEPPKKFVTEYTKEDVEILNYEEVLKALKNIQSKKSNAQYDENEQEYEKALKIEEMLLEHKEKVQPINDYVVRKSQVNNLIEHFKNQDEKVSKEYIVEQLERLID